jgi:abortive infection bacteriophage resistance protein
MLYRSAKYLRSLWETVFPNFHRCSGKSVPANLSGLKKNAERRLFGAILALKALYPDIDKWNTGIQSALCSLIESYSGIIHLDHIGFPLDWSKVLKQSIK